MNEDQKQLLDRLVDEELTGRKPKFQWDDSFQRRLLSMLMCDRFFLIQAVDKVKPEYFSNQAHVVAARLLFDYFRKYKDLPEPFFLQQAFKEEIKDREENVRLYLEAEIKSIYDYYVPGVESREALIDKITYFAKVQAAKEAFHKVLPKIMEKPEDDATWEFYFEQTRNVMLIDRDHDPGLELFINLDELFAALKQKLETRDRFTTSFEAIDNALTGGGLFRGEIGAWIALPGTGKSLSLVKAAVANVKMGHKVLYLTMEMDESGIGQRFLSQMLRTNVNRTLELENEIKADIAEFTKDLRDPNLLAIKQFPGGQIDVNGIRAFHSQCVLRKFKPDLVIVDYVGEMKMDPKVPTHESMYRILRDLRGFGVEEQHCTLTCIQPNRTAAQLEISQYIDESNIGSSFDQFKPLDAFWSINQQVEEKDAGVGRGFVIKHRNGRSRFPFYMGFDYEQASLDVYQITKDQYKLAMSDRAATVEAIGEADVPSSDKKKQRSKGGFRPQDDVDPSEGA